MASIIEFSMLLQGRQNRELELVKYKTRDGAAIAPGSFTENSRWE